MDIFAKIVEERIARAIEAGEFDNLKGAGSPLNVEDDLWVAEDLRLAYRILKNAGCIPPELEKRKEILNLRDMMNTIDDDGERLKKLRELNFKLLEFNMMRKRPLTLEDFPPYEQRVFEKFTGS
ncbi:MAG TPA: DnaJ family domain-containing protein [Thermodesulfovibrionales bacterium]|nr:DnaJ family domain-containing protein [Thermodesulfovibrionales bacterium]